MRQGFSIGFGKPCFFFEAVGKTNLSYSFTHSLIALCHTEVDGEEVFWT